MSKIKTFFICSGLGVINRGYESFTRECFDALKTDQRIDAYLYKGGGASIKREKTLFNLPRFKTSAKFLGKLFGKEGYTIEQFTFCISLIPFIILKKPQVILVSDFILSTYLWHVRRFLNLKYKILFSNGAPNGPPFHRCDHVQQLLPIYYQLGIDGGTPPQMMTIIPYGIKIPKVTLLEKNTRSQLRDKLGIPTDGIVILSVGAINDHHKRMSYLIKEFAKMTLSNAFLVILGQMETSSPDIITLAKNNLPKNNFIIKSVPYESIQSFYQCADFFVLTSLNEGFGRVFLEALTFGLPVITHDAPVFHEVMGEKGYYLNLSKDNELVNFITQEKITTMNTFAKRMERIDYTKKKYSWEALNDRYVSMIEKTATIK